MNKFYHEDTEGNNICIEYKDKTSLQIMVDQARAILGFEPSHKCNCDNGSSVTVPDAEVIATSSPRNFKKAEDSVIIYQKQGNQKFLRLFLGQCCETDQYRVRESQDEIVKCRICNGMFDNSQLVVAESVCPNCGYRTVFTTSMSATQHKCKSCESPIDLMYVDKADKIMSTNLVR